MLQGTKGGKGGELVHKYTFIFLFLFFTINKRLHCNWYFKVLYAVYSINKPKTKIMLFFSPITLVKGILR